METTKIAANIKASVLRLAVNSQWCERTLWWHQLHPSPASPDVFKAHTHCPRWRALTHGNVRWRALPF